MNCNVWIFNQLNYQKRTVQSEIFIHVYGIASRVTVLVFVLLDRKVKTVIVIFYVLPLKACVTYTFLHCFV